ncbi:MAG: hypothetical protein GX167_03070, partial [Firmicutes bacterium]|nr:hypothetical protein [Bacillota bacterium]
MKKALIILLVLVLALSLIACGGGGSKDTDNKQTSPPGGTGGDVEKKTDKPYPHANPDGTPNLDRIAHYDHEYDYT